MDRIFVEFSVNKLNQLASRIEDCVGRLTDEQIWQRGSAPENAAGNLILHLTGNLSQWILAGVAGQPYERDRDGEFAATGGVSREQLLSRFRETVSAAAGVIANLTGERLREKVHIQNYRVSVCEAVYHVVEHFAQHTGQIIFLTKLLTSTDLGYYKHLTRSK